MLFASLMSLLVIFMYMMACIGLAVFIVVMFKLAKAIDIWIERNR